MKLQSSTIAKLKATQSDVLTSILQHRPICDLTAFNCRALAPPKAQKVVLVSPDPFTHKVDKVMLLNETGIYL